MMEVIHASDPGIPQIDVMVPTHNRLDLTMKCIETIYLHTQLPFHLIVVDDSTDGGRTVGYLQELIEKGVSPVKPAANMTFIHSDEPFREGNQFFNIALRYCLSDYMATVMNSMRVEPDWELFAINNLLKQNPDVGLIGLKCLFGGDLNKVGFIESAGIKMAKYLPTDIGRDFPGHRLTGVGEPDAIQWAFAIVRRRAALGNLEEGVFYGFKGWDDIDNSFAVKAKGWRVLYCGMGCGFHVPRATRGDDSEEAGKQNRTNGMRFYKRWGLWEQFVKEYPENADLHELPRGIKQVQDSWERKNFQQVRD